eukprot:jgi/Ulvmu1/4217/UM019_0196.1
MPSHLAGMHVDAHRTRATLLRIQARHNKLTLADMAVWLCCLALSGISVCVEPAEPNASNSSRVDMVIIDRATRRVVMDVVSHAPSDAESSSIRGRATRHASPDTVYGWRRDGRSLSELLLQEASEWEASKWRVRRRRDCFFAICSLFQWVHGSSMRCGSLTGSRLWPLRAAAVEVRFCAGPCGWCAALQAGNADM